MPHRLAALILLALTAGLIHGSGQHLPTIDDEQTKRVIISLERKSWEFVRRRDMEGLATLLSEGYRDVGEFGIWDKKRSVQSIAEPGFELSNFSLNNFRMMRLAPTVVLLTYEAVESGSSNGKPLPSQLFISSVWEKQKGKWLNVLYHDTPAAVPIEADNEEVKNQVLALEKRLSNANANEIFKLESDDFEAIKHLHRYHREDDIAAAKDMKMESWSMDDISVRLLHPDVELITYRVTQKGTFRGIELPDSIYLSSIWVKQGEQWKNVFLAETGRDVFTDTYMPSSNSQKRGLRRRSAR